MSSSRRRAILAEPMSEAVLCWRQAGIVLAEQWLTLRRSSQVFLMAQAHPKPEPLTDEEGQELHLLSDTYLVVHDSTKVLPGTSMRLRPKPGRPRIDLYPRLARATKELESLNRAGTLLRLLRALRHFETHGVVRGESAPSAEYFNRSTSLAERRLARDVPEVVVLGDSDDEGTARSWSAIDVEEYIAVHNLALFDFDINIGQISTPTVVKREPGTLSPSDGAHIT